MADGNIQIKLEIDSRLAEIELIKAERSTLILKRSIIDADLERIENRLQELCDHSWQLAQVAGEGRYCTKCMKHDFEFND